ncbi:MAG: M20 family metallopeptidase [Gemmatimonadota bacterium]|nr:M20 family metallopeptidase [Gemmatimonadota bacterium]
MTLHAIETLFDPTLRAGLFDLRRDLHRHPELAFQEVRTAARLEAALGAAGADDVRRVAGTGLVARVPGRHADGPVVALRGDIDALPIHEETGVAFASATAGVMHACGHDVHATWTIGAAHLLARQPAVGEVRILLQPAEELGRGALALLEAGALDGVRAIVGGHVDMRIALGQVIAEPGPIAGSTDEFVIEVVGRGGHAARPHEARDPIVAAAGIVIGLQTIVARRLAPGEPAVVTVATFQAGTAENVIPERARLTGTLRAVRPDTRLALQAELRRTAEAIAAAHDVEARVDLRAGTPPIINSGETIGWARTAVTMLLGQDAFRTLPTPNLGGEDFAFYLERLPGCFIRIGAHEPGTERTMAHTPRFLPDERAILIGAAVLAETARRAAAELSS